MPDARRRYRHYLPLFPAAIRGLDLTGHDLVLSSRHAVAKGASAAATGTETVASPDQLAQSAGALSRLAQVTPAQRLNGARSRAVVSFADELVDDPSLLAAWSQTFTGADDVTLVIYAPGWSAEDAGARLGAAVEAAGLGAEDAADLMAVATPATPALEAQLATGCSAVLTRRAVRAPFSALPVVAADALPGLRAAAVA